MKHLQRHWRLITSIFCGVLLMGGVLWLQEGQRGALADPQEPGDLVYELQRDGTLALLDDLALNREAFVALNFNPTQAEAVLTSVQSWYLNNSTLLETNHLAITQALEALRELRGSIAMGQSEMDQPGQAQAIAAAVQELSDAYGAYAASLEPLQNAVQGYLSETQQAAWAHIGENQSNLTAVSLLALTSQQQIDLSRAYRHFRYRRSAASNAEERAASVSEWQSARAQIFSPDQMNLLATYAQYYAPSSSVVAAAFDSILPTPASDSGA